MAKAQKLKSTKKMSPEARATVGNAFKGIISNQACVDGGKDSPWWVAVIFLVLSILLPLIPIMVSASKTYGAQILSQYNYGVDTGLYDVFEDACNDDLSFKIEGGNLHFYDNDVEITDFANDNIPVERSYLNESTLYATINLELYITNKSGALLSDLINEIAGRTYKVDTCTPYTPLPDETVSVYTPSFLILTPDTMGLAIYKQKQKVMATSSLGGLNWKSFENGTDLIPFVLGNDPTAATPATVLENFKVVLNKTYETQKGITFRNNTLIYLGVYACLIVFMGLLVFILTRGKNNPFSYLSFFKCQRITWWAAFTPALLGLVFAFLFSGNMLGQMSFVIFLALRIMWMSMRQLRPAQ